jgi:hypothetical protein
MTLRQAQGAMGGELPELVEGAPITLQVTIG